MSIVWYCSSPKILFILWNFKKIVSYSKNTKTKFIWLTAKAIFLCGVNIGKGISLNVFGVNIGKRNLFECLWYNSVLHLHSVSKTCQKYYCWWFNAFLFLWEFTDASSLIIPRDFSGILWNIAILLNYRFTRAS